MVVRVLLVPVNGLDVRILDNVEPLVTESLGRGFRVLVSVWSATVPLAFYDFSRMQYRAEAINAYLSELFKDVVKPGRRLVVGVVEGDGYADDLNFVFGLATPGTGVASVYTRRLWIDAHLSFFLERLAKVITHEVGHLMGLPHCRNNCVMRFSNSLAELDAKPRFFCPSCRARLDRLVLDVDNEG